MELCKKLVDMEVKYHAACQQLVALNFSIHAASAPSKEKLKNGAKSNKLNVNTLKGLRDMYHMLVQQATPALHALRQQVPADALFYYKQRQARRKQQRAQRQQMNVSFHEDDDDNDDDSS